MPAKPTERTKPGPEPERLVITGDPEEALRRLLRTPPDAELETTMSATRTSTWEMWHAGTLSEIERVLEGVAPDSEERRRGIEELAVWIRSKPATLAEVIRSAVDSAVQSGRLTKAEADRLWISVA
jgi:hypothetical protein